MSNSRLDLQAPKSTSSSIIAARLGNVHQLGGVIAARLGNFHQPGGVNQQAMNGLMTNAKNLLEFLKKPHVRAVLLAAGVSFTSVFLLMAGFGFNILGIGAGTLAAAFQSALYAGSVPAGSLFATLQSMGMLGTLLPVQIGLAGAGAAVVSAIVWALGGGRE